MCYVDYDTVGKGRSIFDQLRLSAAGQSSARFYEFSLFQKVKNRLVKKDWFYLPFFDIQCLNIFLESAAQRPAADT